MNQKWIRYQKRSERHSSLAALRSTGSDLQVKDATNMVVCKWYYFNPTWSNHVELKCQLVLLQYIFNRLYTCDHMCFVSLIFDHVCSISTLKILKSNSPAWHTIFTLGAESPFAAAQKPSFIAKARGRSASEPKSRRWVWMAFNNQECIRMLRQIA